MSPSPATGLPVLGMVGAGQLARMTQQAAIGPGLSLRVLADSPGDGAAQVCADVVVGDYRALPDLAAFAAGCDVVTFDHEHVPGGHLRALAAAGAVLRPGPDALRYAQDKRAMREVLTGLGLPVPRWVPAIEALPELVDGTGWPVVIKAVSGGYDGRGVWVVDGPAALDRLRGQVGELDLYAEEAVPLRRELAAVVARRPGGELACWPVVETVQEAGICVEVLAPAPDLPAATAAEAQRIAATVATELGVVGVLAVELFERPDGELLVNELAMRPHNSAHWTIEGSRTSQFEQHVRAVLDWPLGDPAAVAPAVVMANLLGGADPAVAARLPAVYAADPGVKVHLYAKESRPGRKLGHVTALGTDLEDVRPRARRAVATLRGPA